VSLLNSSSSNAPRASLPLSVLSLGPKLATSVPPGRLGAQSPPKILLVAMMLSFHLAGMALLRPDDRTLLTLDGEHRQKVPRWLSADTAFW
jgi:hypothetical protein